MHSDNVIQVWIVASATANDALIRDCLPLLAEEFFTLSTDQRFLRYTGYESLIELMESLQDGCAAEEAKVQTIALWINAAPTAQERTDRIDHFGDFLPALEVKKLSNEFMMNLTLNESGFELCNPCKTELFLLWEQKSPSNSPTPSRVSEDESPSLY